MNKIIKFLLITILFFVTFTTTSYAQNSNYTTQTVSLKNLTTVTMPVGKSFTKNSNTDNSLNISFYTPNIDINLTQKGSINIDINGHNRVKLANREINIIIDDTEAIDILTHTTKNLDKSTYSYTIEISADSLETQTTHRLSHNKTDETLTTLVIKTADLHTQITAHNEVIHRGSFINEHNRSLTITAIMKPNGSISIEKKTQDLKYSSLIINRPGGSVTIYPNGNIAVSPADINGTENLLQKLNFASILELDGATTIIDNNLSNPAIVSRVELLNSQNNLTMIEVASLANGQVTHSLSIDGETTQVSSKLRGGVTSVQTDGSIVSSQIIDPTTNTLVEVKTFSDGRTLQKVSSNDFNTSTLFNLTGAETTTHATGEVQSVVDNKATECLLNASYTKVVVSTAKDGTSSSKFINLLCLDDTLIQEQYTLQESMPFERDSNITVNSFNDSLEIIIVTPLHNTIRF